MTRKPIKEGVITIRSLIIGMLLAAIFAVLTIYMENRRGLLVTATQIAVLPYVMLILVVMAINPICRLIRIIRPLSTTEVLLIFIMGAVSAGIPTFGLASQLVPAMSSVFNEHWNNEQSEWNRYVVPYVSDRFLVSETGVTEAAKAYRDALEAREATRGKTSVPQAERDELDRRVEETRAILAEYEAKSFEMVREFRRRMPEQKRAYPGFIPLTDESWTIYKARVNRLIHGRAGLGHVDDAHQLLIGEKHPRSDEVVSKLKEAIDSLEAVTDLQQLEETKVLLDAEWNSINAESLQTTAMIDAMRSEQRLANLDRAEELGKELHVLNEKNKGLNRRKVDIRRRIEQVQIQISLTINVREVIRELERIAAEVESGEANVDATVDELAGLMRQFRYFDASLERFLVGDVPWGIWAKPLFNWGVLIVLTYVMLMTFNVLIFRQWAYNERLIYPLAKLPEILAGAEGVEHEAQQRAVRIPAVFRNGLFYVGMGISFIFVGWNLLAMTGWIPGLTAIPLRFEWNPYIADTIFQPLTPGAKFGIFFTMIGLAFLIPADISFSLWFFWLLYMVQLLIVVWSGHGVNEKSFSSDWWYTLNFRSAEAGGALMVFSSVVLYKCRRYLFCAFQPAELKSLDQGERTELRISSGLFLLSSLGLIVMLWLGMGANLFYTIILYVFILILTIGLVRAVTEGGVLAFQAWISPFHLVRSLFGFNHPATAPSLFAPLMVFYSIIFLDIKTFIAPAMANSLKIRDDLKMPRLRFHTAIMIGIGVTVIISVIVHLMMGYSKGADAMMGWFYEGFPKGMYDNLANMAKSRPVDQTANNVWLGFGALVMTALLYFRQFVFWLPHPIGLIMLINPIMGYYWFSIFIGWLAKFLVTRYGNKHTYQSARNVFIGLIVGELLLVVLAMVLTVLLEVRINIDLNRNY